MDNQDILDALRELKDAVEPVVSDDDGCYAASHGGGDVSAVVTGPELDRLTKAWSNAVGIVGRIDRPAQYRPIPF